MTELRVLTVRQPWASLIALGHKRIEVRSRATNFRGWVAIHAGKARPKRQRIGDLSCEPYYRLGEIRHVKDCGCESIDVEERCAARSPSRMAMIRRPSGVPEFFLPLGVVVAVARIVESLPIIEEERGWTEDADTPDDVVLVGSSAELDRYDVVSGFTADLTDQSPYAPAEMWTGGHHGWMLDDVRQLDQPIPFKGGIGLRYPTFDLAQQLAPVIGGES